jgi:hypothetical protein
MDTFSKQPYEEFTIYADFSQNLLEDEVVSSQTVTITDKSNVNVSSTVSSQASVRNDGASKVSVLVRAGSVADSPYKITFQCITSLSHKWDHDVQMIVQEV